MFVNGEKKFNEKQRGDFDWPKSGSLPFAWKQTGEIMGGKHKNLKDPMLTSQEPIINFI